MLSFTIAISLIIILGLLTPVMSFPISIEIDITPSLLYEGDSADIVVCVKDPGNANHYTTPPAKTVDVTLTYPDGSTTPYTLTFTTLVDADTACTNTQTTPALHDIGAYTVTADYTEGGNSISTTEMFVVLTKPCSVTISTSAVLVYLGDDINIRVCLTGCTDKDDKNIDISVYDPKGFVHKATAKTDSTGCTPWLSYLDRFDNMPNTDDAGSYIVVAESHFHGTKGITNFFVDVDCSSLPKNESMGAFVTISYRQRQNMTAYYHVACCDTTTYPYNECCKKVMFHLDCTTYHCGDCNEGTVDIMWGNNLNYSEVANLVESGMAILCQNMIGFDRFDVAYVNSSRYEIIGVTYLSNYIDVRLIDLDECIIGNASICDIRNERLVFNKDLYINFTQSRVVHHDRLCEGYYEAELIPYEGPYELDTSRYVDVFLRNFTDYFYCYHHPEHEPRVPLIVRNTKWCDRMNMRFYSVHPLGGLHIDRNYIDTVNEWNTLAGTIVLGHACPWCRAEPVIFYVCGNLSNAIIKRPNSHKTFETVDFIDFLGSVSGQMNVDSSCSVVCEWSFGDGFKAHACETQHRYRKPGTYTVTLTVYYPFSTSDSLSTTIDVNIVAPDTTKSASILEPIDLNRVYAYYAVNVPIPFAAHATGPGQLSDYAFKWDFDNDGVIDAWTSETSYSYSSAGIYTVKLEVVNASNPSQIIGTDQIDIKVVDMDRPNITNIKMWGCLGKEIEKDTCLEFDIYNIFPSGLGDKPEPLTDINVTVEVDEMDGDEVNHACVPEEMNCCNDKDTHTTHIARIDGQTSGKFYFNNLCHGVAKDGGKFNITIEATRGLSTYTWEYCMECNPDPDGFMLNGYDTCSITNFNGHC